MERVQFLARREASRINRKLERLRDKSYTALVGGRYMHGVAGVRGLKPLLTQPEIWDRAAALLKMPKEVLSFLSCSALDVLPGDPGLGEHVDYPHHVFPTWPHLSAQFILSLDGTDYERAPLWIEQDCNLVCMSPGELLIFGGNTKHGVLSNRSDKPRTTLLWSIGPSWIRPMLKDVWDWTYRQVNA